VPSALGELPWRELCEAGPQGVDAPEGDRGAVDAVGGEGAAVYGELTAEAAAQLFAWLDLGRRDVFVDLGSGVAKLVVQAACTTEVGRAVGVELSRFRHQTAEGIRSALLDRLDRAGRLEASRRIELRCEDLLQTDLGDATVLYAGSTSFPDPLLAGLARRALQDAPRLRFLVSTRPLPSPWDARLRERGRLKATTTWTPHARLYVYVPR
jgi:hypothetical protein